MRYPTATQTQCRDFGRARKRGDPYGVEVQWVGQGEEMDLSRIEEAAAEIRQLMINADQRVTKRDQVEGEAATILYQALTRDESTDRRTVDVVVLDDPGFWRYLALEWFWDFVEWREWKAPERFKESTHLAYVDAANSTESVLTRMYLRMVGLGGSDHQELASCLPRATDFWRSHIIRVRTAGVPCLVRAMVGSQRDSRLKTADLREFAKRINRTWSNVLLDLYTQEEAAQLLRELRIGLGTDYDIGSDGGNR